MMGSLVRVVGKNIILDIKGTDRFFSIKSRLLIPLSHITSVSTKRAKWRDSRLELRVGGSFIPFMVKDGRYLSRRKLYFYVMHDPNKCVTINLNNEKYSAIIFQVNDKEAVAKKIIARLSEP